MTTLEFQPIGKFCCDQKYKNEAPRQPETLDRETSEETHTEPIEMASSDTRPGVVGYIELEAKKNFEQALIGLDGLDRIWVLFSFHLNSHWNPMVQPPRGRNEKIGVFATRAPYRPNSIGMSCLELIRIEGLKIFVGPSDILDQSPILDIKPYLPYADSWPDSRVQWLEDVNALRHSVSFSPQAQSQLEWLKNHGVTQIKSFIKQQLEFEPTNQNKKRVKDHHSFWQISYRTWRIDFLVADKKIGVIGIQTGYSTQELDESNVNYADPYRDKEIHRKFRNSYGA